MMTFTQNTPTKVMTHLVVFYATITSKYFLMHFTSIYEIIDAFYVNFRNSWCVLHQFTIFLCVLRQPCAKRVHNNYSKLCATFTPRTVDLLPIIKSIVVYAKLYIILCFFCISFTLKRTKQDIRQLPQILRIFYATLRIKR
jgi:hypothetical protein